MGDVKCGRCNLRDAEFQALYELENGSRVTVGSVCAVCFAALGAEGAVYTKLLTHMLDMGVSGVTARKAVMVLHTTVVS